MKPLFHELMLEVLEKGIAGWRKTAARCLSKARASDGWRRFVWAEAFDTCVAFAVLGEENFSEVSNRFQRVSALKEELLAEECQPGFPFDA